MPYTLTPEQAASITDPELVFGTTRLLPEWDDIPEDFKARQNVYCKLSDCLFYGMPLPEVEVEFFDGFTPDIMRKCVMAHLTSHAPRAEHKTAGIGYMISKMATLSPIDQSQVAEQVS